MSKEDKIKDIFQDAFENFEAPVKPSVWSGIESGMNTAGNAAGGAAGSSSSVGSWISSNLVWVAGGAVVATTAVVLAVNVWTSDEPVETQAKDQTTEIEKPVEEQENENFPQEETPDSQQEIANDITSESESGHQEPKDSKHSTEVESLTETDELQDDLAETNSADEDSGIQADASVNRETDSNTTAEVTTTATPAVEDEEPTKDSPENQTADAADDIELNASFQSRSDESNPFEIHFVAIAEDAETYIWNFGDGITVETKEPTVSHLYNEMGEHVVELTVVESEKKETSTGRVEVYVEPVIELPNIFTPNGDGENDYYDIIHAESRHFSDYEISIFTSSNELVFRSHPNEKTWNGELPDGTPAVEGKYIVVVRAWGMDGSMIKPHQELITLRR